MMKRIMFAALVLGLAAAPVSSPAQSLGDLAKAEAARREKAKADSSTTAEAGRGITPTSGQPAPKTPTKVYTNKDLENRPVPTVPLETALAALPITNAISIPQKDLDLRVLYHQRRASLQTTLDADTAVLRVALDRRAFLVHMVTELDATNRYRQPYVDELTVLRRRIEGLARTVDASRQAVHDWEVVNR